MTRSQIVAGDVGHLPDYAFGPTSIGWWGVFGFMLIEGFAFALAIGAYFYLIPIDQGWPPTGAAAEPALGWGTLFVALALLSEIPNHWTQRRAEALDVRGVQLGLSVMTGMGLLLILVRAFEFGGLGVGWDRNAYGSIVWALVVMHTFHTVTDVGDSAVLCTLTWRKKMTGRRHSDVADNALYWRFIVWSGVVVYTIVYWVPRWV